MTKCTYCETKEGIFHDIGEETLCENCYEDETWTCSTCNRRRLSEESTPVERAGLLFCNEDCVRNHPNHLQVAENFYTDFNRLRFFTTNKKNVFNTRNFTVGIEIECLTPRNKNWYNNGLTVPEANELLQRLSVGSDGSVRTSSSNYNEVEIRTQPTSNNETGKLLALLEKGTTGFKANSSCGLHIHIGEEFNKLLTPENRHKIYLFYNIFKGALFDLVRKSRRTNDYCSRYLNFDERMLLKTAKDNPERTISNISCTRYEHINSFSWSSRKTIELRFHHGTVNIREIKNWVNLNTGLFAFVCKTSYARLLRMRGTGAELHEIIKSFDGALAEYYKAKRARMKPSFTWTAVNPLVKAPIITSSIQKDLYNMRLIKALC